MKIGTHSLQTVTVLPPVPKVGDRLIVMTSEGQVPVLIDAVRETGIVTIFFAQRW